MTNILIADDHFPVRIGVELIVREVAGKNCHATFAGNGKSVLSEITANKFDLLVTDLNMPDESGIGLISKAIALQPELKIIVLTVHTDVLLAKESIKAGAFAFISKSAYEDDLKAAINSAYHNRKYLTRLQKEQFINSFLINGEDSNPFTLLSQREQEIAFHLLKGMGILEISNMLALKATTASTYKARIFLKLNIKNVIELYELANRFGFINGESVLY